MECPFLLTAAADVEKLLKDSGVTADKENLKLMMSKLEGKSIQDLIKEGSEDLASMPAAAAAPAGGAAPAEAAAAEPEKKKEDEPEEDVDMGGMFGDDDDY